MYEISLVPDIKAELLKQQKLRNLVILICIIVSIACGAVIMILLGFTGTQGVILSGLDAEATCRTTGPSKDVKKCEYKEKDGKVLSAIMKVQNYEELLTIQDQMRNITLLNNEKVKMSRIFPVLDVILPTGDVTITISELSADLNTGTIYFDAIGTSANNIAYLVIETYEKNANRAYFDYGDYMRPSDDQSGYEVIPSFCITEVMDGGQLWGIYHKGASGCEAKMVSEYAKKEDVLEDYLLNEEEETEVEDIWILRGYKTDNEIEDAKNGNVGDGSKNVKKGYYFESKCLVYDSTTHRVDTNASLEACPLIPNGVQNGSSGKGKDSDGNRVLTFTSVVDINMEVFKASNKHMRIIGPPRKYVTDSYVQVRDMFSEKVTEDEE